MRRVDSIVVNRVVNENGLIPVYFRDGIPNGPPSEVRSLDAQGSRQGMLTPEPTLNPWTEKSPK